MLLSRHIKLVGAFNHLHIFLDPDPDPETSFEERERLFVAALLVVGLRREPHLRRRRRARARPSPSLSPYRREMLGVEEETLTPNEVIGLSRGEGRPALQRRHRDVREVHEETNADVGDRANDAVVDGGELGCRVVGEGGNLGFTQRGRVEYALGGGRIYMDAIDNSAGVDCSTTR